MKTDRLSRAACWILLTSLVVFSTACDSTPAEPPSGTVLLNVRVFDAESGGFTDPTGVLVREGRVHETGPPESLPVAADTLDAAGSFALPGLWDSHIHLAPLTLTGEDSLATALEQFVQAGILYVRDVGGPLEAISSMSQRVSSGDILGPEIFFSGPMLERPPLHWGEFNEELPGFTVPVESEEDVDRLVEEVATAGGSFVKVFNKWDLDLFSRILQRAEERGLGVVLDPGPPVFQSIPVDTALALGATSIEHAFAPVQSVLAPELRRVHDSLALSSGQEGLQAFLGEVFAPAGMEAIDGAALRRLGQRWAESGAFHCPTLRVMPGAPEWGPEAMREILRSLDAAGVRLLVGQDDHRAAYTFEEMEALVEVGISPEHVLKAATIHAAMWMGLEDELGSLTPGHRADLLLVRGNPLEEISVLRTPWMVMREGVVVFRAG